MTAIVKPVAIPNAIPATVPAYAVMSVAGTIIAASRIRENLIVPSAGLVNSVTAMWPAA